MALSFLAVGIGQAFPPAPHHKIFGTVRDSKGNPLSESAIVILKGTSGELLRGPVDTTIEPGANYVLKVPMDSGTLTQLYRPTALQPTMPFTISVRVGNTSYVPLETKGPAPEIGEPAKGTRLDLTLGIDSDGDGLPDAWETDLVNSDRNDAYVSISDIRPGDDMDGDGISNLSEYIAGTYAFDGRDGLKFDIVDIQRGRAHMRFLTITGRTYTVKMSTDGQYFADVPFATAADSEATLTSFLAQGVAAQDLYIPVDITNKNQLYRLHVE
ncbi:MAG: hypothetical protein ACI9R3_004853 [Verrucomicrobiales bacterium]|jgi:hypothetical protein